VSWWFIIGASWTYVADIELDELRPEELPAASALLARAYRDNPWMLALLEVDADSRERILSDMHGFRIAPPAPPAVVARRDGDLVGVCGFDAPVRVERAPEDLARLVEALSAAGPGTLGRLQEMLIELERRSPAAPHWHLGPVGVRVDAQKQGIGGRMIERFCEIVDKSGEPASLETEVEHNVRLYERSGFEVTEEAVVLGVPAWFMLRRPG
jgi:ribosomal protein S18 acetylase RimI-like enzyme